MMGAGAASILQPPPFPAIPSRARSVRRTKASQIYKKTGNLRAVQLLLGHAKLESTVRYLGIEVDDALVMSEQVDL
jgi:integrase